MASRLACDLPEQTWADEATARELSGDTGLLAATTHNIPVPYEEIGAHSNLIGLLLSQQSELSAVEMFAYLHDETCLLPPTQAKFYRSLLPALPPAPGEQYAFDVDLDRCSGCKACVTACHALNGLDESEAWRDVGVLYTETADQPFLQHITSACHHCVDPACMKACPTNAYEKDLQTGIVRHLDDQCFGCQYCTLACPYGVPKYHEEKGIVRKCDMCSQRLSVGEAPACVQACPHEAISITTVNLEDVRQRAVSNQFLPQTHHASYTQPTTRYRTTRPLPEGAIKGDAYALHAEHAHLPLVVMLVLMQTSLGGYLMTGLLVATDQMSLLSPAIVLLMSVSFLLGQIGLASATLHLGRPMYAFRGVLGFRHSWLSREAIVFGAFAAASGLTTSLAILSNCVPWLLNFVPLSLTQIAMAIPMGLVASILTGLAGTFCSAMVYIFTQRAFWNPLATLGKFFGTALTSGLALSIACLSVASAPGSVLIPLCVALLVTVTVKVLSELFVLRHAGSSIWSDDKKSALLLLGPLRRQLFLRVGFAIVGAVFAVLFMTLGTSSPVVGVLLGLLTFLSVVASDLVERLLFFEAVIAPRMPGGFQ